MATSTPSTTSTDQIWHTTKGDSTKPALLLLHGIFCSHIEFTPLIPLLKEAYYIILVDLPGHSRSRSAILNTYRLAETVDALAKLIQKASPSGKAHVAGMSYGSFVGLELARKHPDVVESLFASGAPPFEGKERYFASRPHLMWCVVAASMYAPEFLYGYVSRSFGLEVLPELRKETKENFTTPAMRNAYADCLSVTLKEVGEIQGVRVAAVAGGKQDNVDVTRRMGIALRESDPASGCRAFVVRKAIHGWDLQFPDLFAQGIRCWIERDKMPAEYEELEG